ncbi:MAG: T9SS type A sorting domain-containing protein, partial [Bacteroidota bacterium]
AHEMGHYLFGGGHIDFASNLCLMSGLPVWNASRGMHSWERQKLGWISYTDKTTDGSVTMFDYLTSDQVCRVPINSSEYFLIENRQKLSSHDQAGDTGFYFYKINAAQSYPPTIDVLCADGNWNFNFNTSTLTITRLTQNPSSTTDEMNIHYWHDSNSDGWPEIYSCYTPVYHENAAWGDNEDAFDLTFNNVLSPVSNPRSTNSGSLNFTIEVTGTNTIQFYFTNPYAGKPSKPQNFRFTYSNPNNPSLAWDLNTEPDISSYNIYRSYDNTGWDLAGNVTHPTNTFVDYAVSFTKPIWAKSVKYYLVAVDNTSLSSAPSNQVETTGIMNPQPKINTNDFANTKVSNENIHNFDLYSNYPNPFNPSTKISYSLPDVSFVTLKVFDILGREIVTLVNEVKPFGNHEVEFDASELPSGTYVYKLTAGNYQTVRKMLLIK